MKKKSIREERIRKITQLYYSKPEVQEILFNFGKNREISPRYFEGFGTRPDNFQFKGDVFSLVKKGATSFHCSEELWEDALKIETGMDEKQANEIRIGWDLLIDIDCKWFDFSKLALKSILQTFKDHGIKNYGIKFSGSKGWHVLIPWKAFPKDINGVQTKDLFPELPRKVVGYIRQYSEKIMKELLPSDFNKQFKNVEIKKGIKCKKCGEVAQVYDQVEFYCKFCKVGEIRKIDFDAKNMKFKCPECTRDLEEINKKEIFHCQKCDITSEKNKNNFTETIETDLFELMGLDLILVSPRHLFRMPYSLHEKTSLASIVIDEKDIDDFDLKDADPMKVKVKNFVPNSKENETAELVMQALDWAKSSGFDDEIDKKAKGKYANFKPIELKNVEESQFPPCIKKLLLGLKDGRKRGLFVLINFFRSIGLEKEILEKKIYEWNTKNEVALKKGYINSQLVWTYKRKPMLPQNCKEFYQNLGICNPDNLCMKIKNPVNYTVKKNYAINKGNRSTYTRGAKSKSVKNSTKRKTTKKSKNSTKPKSIPEERA
ncbi:MAG: hypothetical protein U9Q99_01430 [Nanoarchaeota archaeon]|nr:hypothetical protein [Nanoarchaeota archaeon]